MLFMIEKLKLMMREYGIIKRLHDLEHDGLIELNHYRLSVPSKGKIFLRNICLAMDLRY